MSPIGVNYTEKLVQPHCQSDEDAGSASVSYLSVHKHSQATFFSEILARCDYLPEKLISSSSHNTYLYIFFLLQLAGAEKPLFCFICQLFNSVNQF